MLIRALTFDGFVEEPDWVYRWRNKEWGATGVAHYYRVGEPEARSRAVLHHILDRLELRHELRWAWCVSHAEDVIVHEFRGVWPRSVPEQIRARRVISVRVRDMWDLGPFPAPVEILCQPEIELTVKPVPIWAEDSWR